MKQLELLPEGAVSQWEDLGYQLNFTADQLDTISSNHDEKAVETCCKEMLKKWLKKSGLQPQQAAEQLIAALHKVDNNSYAEQLKAGECLILYLNVLCIVLHRDTSRTTI